MQVGWSKCISTPEVQDIAMMGYAHEKNIIKGKSTELYARCIWFESAHSSYVLIYLDINYISANLHNFIVKKLTELYKLSEHEIHITASHTHSAPGGYGDKLYYEVPTPGFQDVVFDTYTKGILQAVKSAHESLGSAKLSWGRSAFALDVPVAFNRSLDSFLNNPEANGDETIESAVNREMDQLIIKKENHTAVVNWFGCHTTSIPNSNTSIHFDNKGYAAELMEEYLGEGSLAIFAQATSGDITPNYIFDNKAKHSRGPYTDFEKNAKLNGNLQFTKAREILDIEESVSFDIQTVKKTFRFTELTSSDGSKTLGSASFGLAFIRGTKEGPGLPGPIASILIPLVCFFSRVIVTIRRYFHLSRYKGFLKIRNAHGNKEIFINATDKEFLGLDIANGIPIAGLLDPHVAKLNRLLKLDLYKDAKTWYEDELPLQLVKLGELLIVCIPFEPTTMAGRRIKKHLSSISLKHVIISSYSNAYAGYITTPEEYDCQAYEGGHTVFGRETLPILLEKLGELVGEFETEMETQVS